MSGATKGLLRNTHSMDIKINFEEKSRQLKVQLFHLKINLELMCWRWKCSKLSPGDGSGCGGKGCSGAPDGAGKLPHLGTPGKLPLTSRTLLMPQGTQPHNH